MRCLKGRPPASDLFGVKGRRWLAEQELPLAEHETVDAALRQVEFLDSEIAAVEALIAAEALSWPEVKRLMTVPGVNVIVAATFMAAIGDIGRFPDRRKLTGYLGLDPRVRQSGVGPASHGHISKQGSASARHALVEASWSTVRQPGPIAGFYVRIKARRGHSIAIVASARKLACLFWCLLTRGEDYAFAQPSLTNKKMRRLELAAGAPAARAAAASGSTNEAMRKPSASSRCRPSAPTSAPSPTGSRRRARARQRAAHLVVPRRNRSRGRQQGPSLRFDSSSLAPARTFPRQMVDDQANLTFIRRPKQQPGPSRVSVLLPRDCGTEPLVTATTPGRSATSARRPGPRLTPRESACEDGANASHPSCVSLVRTRIVVLAIATALAGLYARVLRKRILNWGATNEETSTRLPGDELLDQADGVSTRAIDIDAPPAAVWPWLAQMGPAPRGGAYTYD